MPGFSLVICCYNSENRLPSLFAALTALVSHSPGVDVETIFVDNNSNDSTASLINDFINHETIPCKYIVEDKQGLLYARIAGVRYASKAYLAFLDDDNLPCKNYFSETLKILQNGSALGVCVSNYSRSFSTANPLFIKYSSYYAVGRISDSSTVFPKNNISGWGAGFCAYTESLKLVLGNQDLIFLLKGRTANIQMSGDDSELFWLLKFCGFNLFSHSTPLLEHCIDPSRLTKQKLLEMFKGNGLASLPLTLYKLFYSNTKVSIIQALTLTILSDLIWIPRRIYYHSKSVDLLFSCRLDMAYLFYRYRKIHKFAYYIISIRQNHRILSELSL